MQRERVTERIYVFTSSLYVQVTATAIITSVGAVLVDTLLYPEETQQIKRFVEDRLGASVKYVINSHHHADHTTGTCFFPEAQVISHHLCRELLDTRGRDSLERMKASSTEMEPVQLILPELVFEDHLRLQVGDTTLELRHSPGHSADSITCLVENDQVMIAADTVMALPYFVDGSYDNFLSSLKQLKGNNYESIIQGHGEVILRGEIEDRLQSDIQYLEKLHHAVTKANAAPTQKLQRALEAIRIESCGKNRVLLNGAVQQLHRQNVLALAKHLREQSIVQTE